MKIVFTSSYKTYFKDNTRNYVANYYVLPLSQIISKKKLIFFVLNYKQKRPTLLYLIILFQKIIFSKGKLDANCFNLLSFISINCIDSYFLRKF